MLIYQSQKSDASFWGIWKIEESTEELLSMLDNNSEFLVLSETTIHKNRLREKLAVRVLLKMLLGKETQISYTSMGQPYLVDSVLRISISHTKGYAAIVLFTSGQMGIDIEYISEKVNQVKSRFINDREYIDPLNETRHLLLHWSAKESIYKALAKEGVHFKNDVCIEPFTPKKEGNFNATESFSDKSLHFNIQYYIEDDYVLTLAFAEN